MNLQDHIRRYFQLVASANTVFEAVQREHGHLMGCKQGCDECCSVYYELDAHRGICHQRHVRSHREPRYSSAGFEKS